MIFSWVKYTDMEGDEYPDWADGIGWLMTLTCIVAIIVVAVYLIITTEGSCGEVCSTVTLIFFFTLMQIIRIIKFPLSANPYSLDFLLVVIYSL